MEGKTKEMHSALDCGFKPISKPIDVRNANILAPVQT